MKQQGSRYLSKSYLVGFLLCGFVVIGCFGYGYFKFTEMNREIGELKAQLETKDLALKEANAKRSESEQNKNLAEDRNKELALTLAVISNSATELADVTNRLDTLVLSDDSRNREFIKWLIDSAQFDTYDGTLAEAVRRNSTWEAYMKTSDAEYRDIDATIDGILQNLTSQIEVIEALKKTNDAQES